MSLDVADLATFYATPLGGVARSLVGRAVRDLWPDVDGLSLLGLGFATPYLPEPKEGSARIASFMPARQGVTIWPDAGPAASALVDPLVLPLPDDTFDRVILVHALETEESPGDLLQEVARIMTPAGRAILVCPNRRGLWARRDTTPFGHGQPFSRSQLRKLLRTTSLVPERWAESLYVPPIGGRLVLSSAAAWERVGSRLSLPFAGLHVVEASKQLHRPIPVRAHRRAARHRPVLVPVPASSGA